MSTELQELFDSNRAWAAKVESREPGFFSKLLEQQTPQYLWIGCADSRVPANELVGLLPGELFVHRNVANVVVHSDMNALSVIQFAVDGLKVQHIIVVGHSNCGGVKAALNDLRLGLVDNWIRHVKDVRFLHEGLLQQVPAELRLNALVELNVLEQARNVCHTSAVEDAWARGQEIVIHGWVYGLHNGLLQDLRITARAAADVQPAYTAALRALSTRYTALGSATPTNLPNPAA
jgi:carbonic anhydrase